MSSTMALSRRIERLEALTEPADDLTILDILRGLEIIARTPEGLAQLEEVGILAEQDEREAKRRRFYTDVDGTCSAPMLDGKDGRWPVLRGLELWNERQYPEPGELRSAETEVELAERWQRFTAGLEA